MSDPMDRLSAANPVPDAVSHPSDPRVEATLEEIMSTENHVPDASGRAPRWRLQVAVAAALLIATVGTVAAFGGFDGGDDDVDQDLAGLPTNPDDTPDDTTGDPFPDGEPDEGTDPDSGGISLSSCVEMYSPETLPNREVAFDGTVTAIDGDLMTFTVNEWFAGGSADTITLDHQGQARALLDPETTLEPGARILGAGDGGFLWSCGFTQLYTEAGAAEWRAALGG